MPNAMHSKASRDLANVRLQLKLSKTRGTNPRPLTLEEVQSLEVRRDKLQAEMSEAKRRRVVDRVNTHTTQESEETRRAVREEGEHTRKAMQPIIDLITVKDTDNKQDAIMARQTQIAFLQAANHRDRQELQQDAAEAKAKAPANANATPKAQALKKRPTRGSVHVAMGKAVSPSTLDKYIVMKEATQEMKGEKEKK